MDCFKIIVIDEGKIFESSSFCIFFPSDDYKVEFDMKSTDTIRDLKLKFEEEEGIPPEHQSYFSGPVELEDETLVSTLL